MLLTMSLFAMESFTPKKTVTLTKDNINDDIDPENCLESMCLFFSTTDSKKINKNEVSK